VRASSLAIAVRFRIDLTGSTKDEMKQSAIAAI
jgi:hypothetical protein